MKDRVLSGVQPTGNLHLGNYLGAIRNWVDMQKDHECLFCIVDLHAITVPQDPKLLRQATLKTAATYIAAGIDPEKSIIFNQSSVTGHSELGWILSTITPIGWLSRMTQFKDKAGKNKEKSGLGLYAYPVLMAADILLYHANKVPVGNDQKQHLELTRDIASAFNRKYDIEYFTQPEPIISKNSARVMSLKNGTNKMSKSDVSDNSRINLSDSNDLIANKIKKAKTDIIEHISYDVESRPETSNLLDIYSTVTNSNILDNAEKFKNAGFANFKQELADVLIDHISPIREKVNQLIADEAYLMSVLQESSQRANEIASENMKKIKEIIGFVDA